MPALVVALVVAVLCAGVSTAMAQTADPHSGHATTAHQKPAPDPHAGHVMPAPQVPGTQEAAPLPDFIPPVTDADRQAAFPDVQGHPTLDNAINYFVLVDHLEWETGGGRTGLGWDTKGWVGRDRDRVWFRAEGQREDDNTYDAQSHVLYGRQISRWWDVVAGIRQDFAPGPAQTWAAVGVQGLAPFWFDVEATAYLGADARNHYRFEAEYELLLTNRLVLQPMAEMEVYGKPDLEHERDRGLATLDFGVRLRVMIRRELAPYAGVMWHQKHFGTADLARANGESTGGARLVVGLRFWL